VQNSLSYPQQGPGSNLQALTMMMTGAGEDAQGAMIRHSDQYRGLEYVDRGGYSEPSPDYFRYVERGGLTGLEPVGYGYRSIEQVIGLAAQVEAAVDKEGTLRNIDREGMVATPANSRFNELTIEAGRLSLANSGRETVINYETNSVSLR
jgi:D-galacturonate reductase